MCVCVPFFPFNLPFLSFAGCSFLFLPQNGAGQRSPPPEKETPTEEQSASPPVRAAAEPPGRHRPGPAGRAGARAQLPARALGCNYSCGR